MLCEYATTNAFASVPEPLSRGEAGGSERQLLAFDASMNASLASSPLDAKQPLPGMRLSISHVMLWTATTAVLFGLLRPTFQMDFSIDGPGADGRAFKILLFKTVLAVFAPIEGAALAGFLLAVWRLVRPGPSFPAQPGHWLLIIVGGWVLVFIASLILGKMRLVYSDSPALKLTHFLRWSVPIALCSLAATWIYRHKFYAWLLPIVGVAIPLIGYFDLAVVMSAVEFKIISAITSAAFVGAIIADIVQHSGHDFFHWTGVVVMGAMLLRMAPYWLS